MPYTIGVRMHIARNTNLIDGIYTFSTYGFPFVLTQDEINKYNNVYSKDDIKKVDYHIYYCETAKDAEELCKALRKSYRYEFKNNAKRQNDKDMSAFRFYPIKINSPKFPIRYDKSTIQRASIKNNRLLCKVFPKNKPQK